MTPAQLLALYPEVERAVPRPNMGSGADILAIKRRYG